MSTGTEIEKKSANSLPLYGDNAEQKEPYVSVSSGKLKETKGIFSSLDNSSKESSLGDVTQLGSESINIPVGWPALATQKPQKFYFWNFSGPRNVNLDDVATQQSVFDDPEKSKLYWPIAEYENLHRVDPLARWSWREEVRVLRKIDFRIMTWCAIMFIALQLDRGNLSQAVADNFLDDLGFNTNVFNNGNTVFKVVFLFCEVPSQLISKKIGPDRWIPIQMLCWSGVAMSQYAINSAAGFYVTRALLGALEGGFIADICLYLSYFYTRTELPVRLAYFWAALTIAEIIAAFMAYGILHMRGVHGLAGWRWLFLIEGAITGFVGLWSAVLMPPGPTKTASWFRGKNGWFTPREETIIVNRVLRDDPSKGGMHNRQALNFPMFWKSLKDYDLWPIYIIGLVFGLSSSPVGTYLTLSLRQLGFTTFQTTLMVLPQQVGGLFIMLANTYISEKFNERSLPGVFAQLWVLACLIPIRTFGKNANRWSKYAVTTVLLAHPSNHAVQVAWTSRNSNSVRTRTLSAAMYNMFVQLSGIISSYIYRADDKPLYHRGNTVLIGLACMNIVIYLLVKLYYIFRNKQKAKKWNAMTFEQQDDYSHSTTDEGSSRLDFVFAH
ncbi:major facilitator superfamily domain-containing protein [Lipomyces japonicus]|uniref:major facilitator superfamily domain-containing protein n=1 Tax=Lipomyces japonicus TaxID=56871 RepID=UPI0034CFC65B